MNRHVTIPILRVGRDARRDVLEAIVDDFNRPDRQRSVDLVTPGDPGFCIGVVCGLEMRGEELIADVRIAPPYLGDFEKATLPVLSSELRIDPPQLLTIAVRRWRTPVLTGPDAGPPKPIVTPPAAEDKAPLDAPGSFISHEQLIARGDDVSDVIGLNCPVYRDANGKWKPARAAAAAAAAADAPTIVRPAE